MLSVRWLIFAVVRFSRRLHLRRNVLALKDLPLPFVLALLLRLRTPRFRFKSFQTLLTDTDVMKRL